MLTVRYSPGPWSIYPADSGWDHIIAANGKVVAKVENKIYSDTNDVNLLLAAPILLRELKNLIKQYNFYCNCGNCNHCNYTNNLCKIIDLVGKL